MATKAPAWCSLKGGIWFLLLISSLVVSAGAVSLDGTGGLNATFQKGEYTDFFALGQTNDSGYLLGGFGYNVGKDSALIIKTDANGTEQWNVTPGGDAVAAVVPLEDGGAVVGTYTVDGGFLAVTDWDNATGESGLVRIDAAGTPLWNVTLAGVRLSGMTQLPDNTIAVSGWMWKPAGEVEAFVGTYDLSGKEIRTATYPEKAARTLAASSDGSLIVGGTDRSTVDASDSSWVMKIDSSGKEVWTKDLANRLILSSLPVSGGGYLLGGSMTELYNASGNVMLATYAWLAKVDGAGAVEWEQKVPGVEIDAMTELPGTGYALAGRGGSVPQIQVVDGNGNVLDGQVWDAWKGRFSSVINTQSGDIVAVGWSIMNGDAEGWLVSSAVVPDAGTPTTPSQTEAPGFLIATACAALAVSGFLISRRR